MANSTPKKTKKDNGSSGYGYTEVYNKRKALDPQKSKPKRSPNTVQEDGLQQACLDYRKRPKVVDDRSYSVRKDESGDDAPRSYCLEPPTAMLLSCADCNSAASTHSTDGDSCGSLTYHDSPSTWSLASHPSPGSIDPTTFQHGHTNYSVDSCPPYILNDKEDLDSLPEFIRQEMLHEEAPVYETRHPLPSSRSNPSPSVTLDMSRPYSKDIMSFSVHEDLTSSPGTVSDGPTSSEDSEPASSVIDTDVPSSGSNSSHTHESISEDDSAEDEESIDHSDDLEAFLKNEAFKGEPEVAEYVYRALEGKVEYIHSSDTEHIEDLSGLSLLQCFGLQNTMSGIYTTYASSSSSSSPSEATPNLGSKENGKQSSSANKGSLGGQGKSGGDEAPQKGSGQSEKLEQKPGRSGTAEKLKKRQLRCIHNALKPDMFCSNSVTGGKYRACAGPGWGSMQHLKEHLQKHHTIKPKPLQCNRCQEDFKSQDLHRNHELGVDCPIRCPDCSEVFPRKADRRAHEEQNHPKIGRSQFFEIDTAMDGQIKEKLKAHLESQKKGKSISDSGLEKWIDSNLQRFKSGRSVQDSKARHELGQWYIIYQVLASDQPIPPHPFYEDTMDSEILTETIILAYDKITESRVQVYGPPSTSDFESQKEFFRDILRDALKVTTRTRIIPRDQLYSSPATSIDTPASTFGNMNLVPGITVTKPDFNLMDDDRAHNNSRTYDDNSLMQQLQAHPLAMPSQSQLPLQPTESFFTGTGSTEPIIPELSNTTMLDPNNSTDWSYHSQNDNPFRPYPPQFAAPFYSDGGDVGAASLMGDHPQYAPPEWEEEQWR